MNTYKTASPRSRHLIGNLRILFSLLRWATALGFMVGLLMQFDPPEPGEKPWFNIVDIMFAHPLPIEVRRGAEPSGITVGGLTGQLARMDASKAGADFVSLLRWTNGINLVFYAAISLTLFELLWPIVPQF